MQKLAWTEQIRAFRLNLAKVMCNKKIAVKLAIKFQFPLLYLHIQIHEYIFNVFYYGNYRDTPPNMESVL